MYPEGHGHNTHLSHFIFSVFRIYSVHGTIIVYLICDLLGW